MTAIVPVGRALRTRSARLVRRALRTIGAPAGRNDLLLWRLKNRHKGRRAFIIGNGPSLRREDLDQLAAHNEICLASNKIYLGFDSCGWRPTYYAVGDADIAATSARAIEAAINCPMFVADYLASRFRRSDHRILFKPLPPADPPAQPDFSLNLLHGVNRGGTITYVLLQIAAWLGIREVFLLGVDCSYSLGQLRPHGNTPGYMAYTYDPQTQHNYFVKDYLAPGEVIVAPDVERSLCAYRAAFEHCHATARMSIYNATRGGQLKVFERVKVEDLF